MKIDIYAKTTTGQIVILYDKEFDKPVEWLEYNPEKKELLFVFKDHSQVEYGESVAEMIDPYMQKAEEIIFFLMDPSTNEPVSNFNAPLKQVTYL